MIKKYYNIIYLIILIILFITASNVNAKDEVYNSYKIGDKIGYNGMEFYVIADSNSNQDYVTLLKVDYLSSDEIIKYGKDHVNRYTQNAKQNLLYGRVAYYSSEKCGYVNDLEVKEDCKNDYNHSDIKYIVDAWAKDNFEENELKVDATGYSARLITLDELTNNLGYRYMINGSDAGYYATTSTPKWVYKNISYWSMTSYDASKSSVWEVPDSDYLKHNNIYDSSLGLVRPVVTVKKNITNSTQNDYDYNKKTYKKGDILYYKGNQYYVLRDALENNSTVTLLKATPLTYGQVNKYGMDHVNMYMTQYYPYNDSKYYKKAYSDNGYGSIAYYSNDDCKTYYNEFISIGCTVAYDKSDVKYVLDNWAKDDLDDNDLSKDKQGYKYRLITLDELNELGYSVDAEGNYSYNANIPRWIYGNYKYFTMTPSDDGNHSMIVVDKDGKLNVSTYNMVTTLAQEYFGTIRPVITLKKATGDEVSKEVVSVPDTLLSMPILGVIIGTLISIVAVIVIYLILKNKHKKTT